MRKAPRNFTLTPKMVGKNPPLPRSYPAFRFVSALATLMLFFTLGLNFVVPQMASQSPAFGMGGGGAPEVFSAEEAPAVPEESAAEAPAATEAPAEEPAIQMVPLPTETLSTTDSAREIETPMGKDGFVGDAPAQDQSQVENEVPEQVSPPIPPTWQIVLAVIALLSALIMVMMRRMATDRWRRRS
jgi:hypothetical protein